MIYGYHRTSTADQHLDRGITEIETFCKNKNILQTCKKTLDFFVIIC